MSRAGVVQVAYAQPAMPELPRLARPVLAIPEAQRARSSGTTRAPDIAQQLQRLEEQLTAGNRVIAEMMDRVTRMEREVAEMRARVQSLPGAGAATGIPVTVAPTAAARELAAPDHEAADRYKRNQVIIDNGLLLLAAGVLLLLVGVAYWTWGRPALKDRLREARALRAAPAA